MSCCKSNDGHTRTAQAMCFGCERRDGDKCDGLRVELRIGGRDCPAGRFADEAGVINWAGLAWYGTPYPLRLWAWIAHPRHPKPRSFAGCGCLVELKTALNKWRALLPLRSKLR